jgi:small redox-active disulfide protein 2
MKIEILGTGCPKCQSLARNAEQAVREAGVQAEIVKVTQIAEIMKRGVMITPALAIDGIVRSAGKVLGPEEIKKLFPAG